MSTSISGQGPAVVPRSKYEHMRTLLALALAAAAALAIALVLVIAISGGSDTVTKSSAAPSTHGPSLDHSACGMHYAGSTLVQGPPCPTR